jgi:hypothetical protein
MNGMGKTHASELIWNGELSGTGISNDGQSLTVGYDAGWSPEQLLLMGAEASFMNTFLSAARRANLRVLGYVSCGHFGESTGEPDITLRPCVVVASHEEVRDVERVSALARRESAAGRLLGDRLRVAVDIQLEHAA